MSSRLNNSSKNVVKLNAKSKGTQELLLYGDISSWDISANMVSAALKDIDAKTNKIEVRLFSGGGDVFEGVAIYNILLRLDKEIEVHIDGISASIASIIMLAGDKVVMGEGSQVMIHKPWAFTAGNSTELMALVDRLDRIENEMIKIYKKKMSASESEIETMLANETWFNADEAIEFGLATDKVADGQAMDIAASINHCDWIKNKHLANKNEEFKNKITADINKFNDILARN